MSDTTRPVPTCPMMGVTLRDPGDGYHATVTWSPSRCRRDKCALWTAIGCGLSNHTTRDAELLVSERSEG